MVVTQLLDRTPFFTGLEGILYFVNPRGYEQRLVITFPRIDSPNLLMTPFKSLVLTADEARQLAPGGAQTLQRIAHLSSFFGDGGKQEDIFNACGRAPATPQHYRGRLEAIGSFQGGSQPSGSLGWKSFFGLSGSFHLAAHVDSWITIGDRFGRANTRNKGFGMSQVFAD